MTIQHSKFLYTYIHGGGSDILYKRSFFGARVGMAGSDHDARVALLLIEAEQIMLVYYYFSAIF